MVFLVGFIVLYFSCKCLNYKFSKRECLRSFKVVSSVFQGSFKGVPNKFLGCSKEVSRVFQESFKED